MRIPADRSQVQAGKFRYCSMLRCLLSLIALSLVEWCAHAESSSFLAPTDADDELASMDGDEDLTPEFLNPPIDSAARGGPLMSTPYQRALGGLATPSALPATKPKSATPPSSADRSVRRAQFSPEIQYPSGVGGRDTEGLSSIVTDPPIRYRINPSPGQVEDIEVRDGPQIPEPMVFDLVRGLGARRGEFEINVLNLVPFSRGAGWEWAPEVEWAIADGFALEFELPIFGTTIQATKYAAQYTFGTALDDAFIHGVQGIIYHELDTGDVAPTLLYLAGLRLNRHWSVFGMFGFSVGPQVFPFIDVPGQRRGTDIITNLSVFYDVSDDLVLGVETNLSRRLEGSAEFLLMPQVHYRFSEHWMTQFGMGYRDDVLHSVAELGFRVIWER